MENSTMQGRNKVQPQKDQHISFDPTHPDCIASIKRSNRPRWQILPYTETTLTFIVVQQISRQKYWPDQKKSLGRIQVEHTEPLSG